MSRRDQRPRVAPVHEGAPEPEKKTGKRDSGSSTTSPIDLRSTPTTTTHNQPPTTTEQVGANSTQSPQPQVRRIRSFRQYVTEVLNKFTRLHEPGRPHGDDTAVDGSHDIVAKLVKDTNDLIDKLQADIESPVPTSWQGKKLNQTKRDTEEKYRTKYRSQLVLARAFLLEGDLTLCNRLLACRIVFTEGELGASGPIYDSKNPTKESVSRSDCWVRGCHFCGGDTREVDDNIDRIIARYGKEPKASFASFTLVLGDKPGVVLVDDIYRAVVAAMNKVAANNVWKDHEAFIGTVRDVELFNKEHEPWGHIHVLGLWATDDEKARSAFMRSIESTWVSATGGLGRVDARPLGSLARNLGYNGKGYAPHTKPAPHLGVSLDQMRAVARLSISQVAYHFTTGCFAPKALGVRVRKRDRKKEKAASASAATSKLAPPRTFGSLRMKEGRQEVHTPQAARARAKRLARPSLGRVRLRKDGSVVDIHSIVLRDRDQQAATESSANSPSSPRPPVLPLGSPEEEVEATDAELERGSGSVALGAFAGTGKSTRILDTVARQPLVPTLLLSFTRSAVSRLASALPKGARVEAKTLHAVGLKAWSEHLRCDVRRAPNKVEQIVQRMVGFSHTGIGAEVVAHVRRAKAIGLRPDELSALGLVNATTASLVRDALEASIEDHTRLDDDDMMYMPVIHDVDLPQPEFTCVDECQDLTPVQVRFVVRIVGNRRCFVVGDRWQSINLYRGADPDALTALIRRLGLRELALSFSHRCPEAIVAVARKHCPSFRAAPHNPLGEVRTIKQYLLQLDDWVGRGVLVLARRKSEFVALRRALIAADYPMNLMFSDDDTPGVSTRQIDPASVNLCTVHGAKGLGASDVCFIDTPVFEGGALRPDEEQQEVNTRYVAITRSSRRLTFLVGGKPKEEP